MLHLLQRAVSNGLNLQTNTPVTSISPSASGLGRWTATTSRGPITATKVIFATNAYTVGLLPEYATKIVPSKGICCRIVTPPSSTHPTLRNTYVLRLPNGGFDYLVPRKDGSLIVGGARTTFFKDHANWYNTTDDSTLISSAASYFDNYMQTHFHGWEDSGARVDQIWTGIMAYTSDELPSVGEIPGREGCFIAAGFEGHGMPVIWLVMKGIAEMVAMGRRFEEVKIPRVYKTTRERLESEIDLLAPKKKG
jgi:glycine/D-amino acid oxidase-like deaminating enzyme